MEKKKDEYPKIVGKCPICGSEVKRTSAFGSDWCTNEECPYDTS